MTTTLSARLRPSRQFRQKATFFSLFAVLIGLLCVYLELDPFVLLANFPYMVSLLGDMLPPNVAILWEDTSVPYAIWQTVAMALLGTLVGGTIAIGLGFLSAANTTPSKALRFIVHTLLSIERVIPSLVIILVFVISVGLGAFAGMLTLTMGTIGTFGKLFAEAIENTESAPAEAIYSVGASKLQVIRYAIFPQVLPSFIANFLYAFDINLRSAIGLGIFGGGGIGFKLHLSIKVLRYPDALALVFITVLLVVSVEKLSDFLRKKLLRADRLS